MPTQLIIRSNFERILNSIWPQRETVLDWENVSATVDESEHQATDPSDDNLRLEEHHYRYRIVLGQAKISSEHNLWLLFSRTSYFIENQYKNQPGHTKLHIMSYMADMQ